MKSTAEEYKLGPVHEGKVWLQICAIALALSLTVLAACSFSIRAVATSGQDNQSSNILIPSPPSQPASGPGGRDYKHASVTINTYGTGEAQYWLFEPASPAPSYAPVIVFNHGWLSVSPEGYGAWIEHLVRRGNIVIYPAFQDWRTIPWEATGNAIAAVKDALGRLGGGGHVAPDLERFAVIGHSLGGAIAVNMAEQAATAGIPEPGALMLVAPGDAGNYQGRMVADLSKIPSRVLMLAAVGSNDFIAGSGFALRIMRETPQVPRVNKDLITVVSDNHGAPPLVAEHFAPIAPDSRYSEGYQDAIREVIASRVYRLFDARVDALDYYAYWKLCDGLIDAAFYGKNRQYALGNTQEQRFMGLWSDGTPVLELRVWPDY